MFLEDRVSRPGPRARRGIDLKYIYYGFAFLQVFKHFRNKFYKLYFTAIRLFEKHYLLMIAVGFLK
jgi:hypothetical protein